jgi:hypothetical protein
MNREERQSIEGKRREEKKADQFLKRNHVDERRQTLISLSSLVLPSLGFSWKKRVAAVGLGRGCAIRKRKGHGGERENRDAWEVAGRDYCSWAITVAVMGQFWTTHNFLIRIPNYACE